MRTIEYKGFKVEQVFKASGIASVYAVVFNSALRCRYSTIESALAGIDAYLSGETVADLATDVAVSGNVVKSRHGA